MNQLVGEELEFCPDNVPALFCVRKQIDISKKKLGNKMIIKLTNYHIHFSIKSLGYEFHIKGYFYHRKIYDHYLPIQFFGINNDKELYNLDGKFILSKIFKWVYPFHEFYF